MIQRRGVATASFAFASQFYQAWNLPGNTAAALRFSSTHFPIRVVKPQQFLRFEQKYFAMTTSSIFERYGCDWRCNPQRRQRLPRLFGSQSGSGVQGTVLIQDDQKALLNIDVNRLQQTAIEIRKLLASTGKSNDYETYDVSIYLIDDETMQDANKDSRKIDEPTDILSFQFHDAIEPGKLDEPLMDVAVYYNLGDILIDVPYVMRSCRDDQIDSTEGRTESSSVDTGKKKQKGNDVNNDEDNGEEEEVWVNDDRGVSGAMSKVFDPELRINMLLVHGMLHLVGYDHEEDDDYELMVKKEEEILDILQRNGIITLPTSSS